MVTNRNGDKTEDIQEVVKFISKDMNKIGIDSLPDNNILHSLDELKKYLTEKIMEMLDRDYNKLLNALYLIDINEKKLHDLFSGSNREFIPEALAELIIERQMEKIMWRKKYRDGKL